MTTIRATKLNNHHPLQFDFPDLDEEDAMAMTCATMDEHGYKDGFQFEVVNK